ncbi:MAG: hypothetical protein Fues2KO_34220 [Fuerstiella sp.]
MICLFRIVMTVALLFVNANAYAGSVSDVVTSTTVESPQQPQAAVGSDGTIYVAFGSGDTIYCSRSADGGVTYQSPVRIGRLPGLALGRRRGPRIVVASGKVVVTAISHESGNLFAWNSSDHGRHWSGPLRVNDSAKDCREGLHAMAASSEGHVYCAWLDLRSGSTEIYGSHSADGGASWTANRRVYRSPSGTVCECCHPAVTYDADGRLSVMWRNSVAGARDMFVAGSMDHGRSFGPARKLGQETWPLNACPMDGGYLASADAGQLTTVWRRKDTVYRTDGPDHSEVRLGVGLQPWAAATGRGTWIVWLERRNGSLMYTAPDRKQPQRLTDAANDPVIAGPVQGPGPVVVVWESGEANHRLIRSQVLQP